MPLVGGHEGTGYVAAIAKNTRTSLKIGDPVGVKWLANSCLGCEDCRKGHETTCESVIMHGYTVDGSFQQWCVSYADHVTPIPNGYDMAAAAPLLCAGVTVYSALKEINGVPGEYVVIPGAGGGLCCNLQDKHSSTMIYSHWQLYTSARWVRCLVAHAYFVRMKDRLQVQRTYHPLLHITQEGTPRG
ncbi:hypothetical protein ON010_g15475 [Phytophthora cinnamomi]|nr:hypothetical protein ON010_g15475 [Phytophthora cinnamomi]